MRGSARSAAAAAVVGLALALAACGGDDAASPVPADIGASITDLGGSTTSLSEVVPGKVYRTPAGYLYGYCSEITVPVQTVTGNICATVGKQP